MMMMIMITFVFNFATTTVTDLCNNTTSSCGFESSIGFMHQELRLMMHFSQGPVSMSCKMVLCTQ
jgi:hypothetical protein